MSCRLLYIVGQLGAGGLERQIYFLLQGMDRNCYKPEVVVWNFNEDETYVPRLRALNVPMHSLSAFRSKIAKLQAFRRLVVRLRPEVVHSYSFYTNFAAWWATRGTRAIAIGAVQSNFSYDRTSCGFAVGKVSARWPRTQIYNNLCALQRARHSRSLFVPRQIVIVRNGLDLQLFRSIPLPMDGAATILGVGSLIQVKRWDRLLKAASNLKNKGLDFRLAIAGSGPLLEWLARESRNLKVADRVRFLGRVDDIPKLLSTATFLAHTSDVEGCPNIIVEAMASGRAVVATDVGDVSAIVEDGKSGFIVSRGDDAMLVERLANLIMNRGLCRRMGERGRLKAETEFGLPRLVDETLAAYRTAGWSGNRDMMGNDQTVGITTTQTSTEA